MSEETFDYVIVGAGSAGCVLADRLSEDGQHSVLVLEYGGSDRSVLHPDADRALHPDEHGAATTGATTPSPSRTSAAAACIRPRGKVLGGSSSINGMVYVRGNPLDFERWAEAGRDGLGLRATCCPISGAPSAAPDGGDEYRGGAGPLQTRQGPLTQPAATRAWLEAGAPGRLSRSPRHQRLPAGRLRPHGHDRPEGPALARRQRLSAAGDDARQPDGRRTHALATRVCSRASRGRRRISPGRRAQRVGRGAR